MDGNDGFQHNSLTGANLHFGANTQPLEMDGSRFNRAVRSGRVKNMAKEFHRKDEVGKGSDRGLNVELGHRRPPPPRMNTLPS